MNDTDVIRNPNLRRKLSSAPVRRLPRCPSPWMSSGSHLELSILSTISGPREFSRFLETNISKSFESVHLDFCRLPRLFSVSRILQSRNPGLGRSFLRRQNDSIWETFRIFVYLHLTDNFHMHFATLPNDSTIIKLNYVPFWSFQTT